ncbi:anaphase-promoting complex, cyclosome, subunit 4-domain-containing protein [Peziza echinospora]|nr:anaphase-promoting complex, cyclosome, subunit 4-domain-containing protein [Peziza echinospora]
MEEDNNTGSELAESIAASSTAASPPGFQIQTEKTLPYPARPGLAAWSPQHDLLCFVTTNDNVLLYRMNGQRVWGLAQRKDKEGRVETLRWRPDGKMLALGYADGVTRICDVNNGKIVLLVSPDVAAGFGKVSCVGWADNRSVSKARREREGHHGGIPPVLEGIPKGVLDLEINQMLPRLSVLPAGTAPDSLFSSKTTLDAMINTVKGGDGEILDVLLVGDVNGKVLVNIFESFIVGTLQLSTLCPQLGTQCKLIQHTAPPSLSTHALLVTSPNNLYLTTLDLLFTSQFGQYLHQLAFTSTKLQALLKYIKETVAAMNVEWKTMNDLSMRYVSLVEEDLQAAGSSSSGGGVGLEFFELLVTGVGSAALKEWLVDVLTERGQKRWEKTSIGGYESLRRLAHEHLLPTCERVTILLTRLRGLARWKERGSPLGLEPEDFTRCIDTVSGLTIYAHSFITKLNHELDLFRCFSAWLKNVLDELSSVININDAPPEDPQIDTLKVAEYVGEHLLSSSLAPFFTRTQRLPGKKLFEDGEGVFEYFCKNETYAKGGSCTWGDLMEHLVGLCHGVFEKPATAMRRSLRVARPVNIYGNGVMDHVQIRMDDTDNGPVAYLALYSKKDAPDALVLVKCQYAMEGGLSSIVNIDCIKLSISSIYDIDTSSEEGEMDIGDKKPKNITLLDVHFVDNEALILLVQNEDDQTTNLLTTPFSTLTFSNPSSKYPLPNRRESFSSAKDLAGAVSVYTFSLGDQIPFTPMEIIKARTFEWVNGFLPERLVVNGMPERRIGAAIDRDGGRYVVFLLDEDEAVEEEGEEEEEEEEEEDDDGDDDDDENESEENRQGGEMGDGANDDDNGGGGVGNDTIDAESDMDMTS